MNYFKSLCQNSICRRIGIKNHMEVTYCVRKHIRDGDETRGYQNNGENRVFYIWNIRGPLLQQNRNFDGDSLQKQVIEKVMRSKRALGPSIMRNLPPKIILEGNEKKS